MRLMVPVVLLAAVAVAGCSSPAAAAPPAQSPLEKDTAAMAGHCTQNAAQLGSMVAAVHQQEVKNGITGESETQLAGHLLRVVEANKGRVSCVDEFAAYLTMREGG